MRNKTKRVIRNRLKNERNKRKTRRCKNKNTLIWGGENPTVEFAKPSEYNVERVGDNNDMNIYQFETENCMKYFYVKLTDKYIVFDNRKNNKIIIVKITETNETNDKIVKEYINSNKNRLLYIQPKNYSLINDGHLFCKTELNLDSCVAILNEWNENLKLYCGDETIRLAFDYVHNLNGNITSYSKNDNANVLLLCLYKENSCVSSIELIFDEKNTETNELDVSVNFKTNEKYEGKKYNLFLQCMAVILCYNLQNDSLNKKIFKLNVTAVNPISAYTPIKYLNGEITGYRNENKIAEQITEQINKINNFENKDEITFQQIKKLFGPYDFFTVEIPVDENNVKNATEKATELLDDSRLPNKTLKCE
jgi:hypothetical protein